MNLPFPPGGFFLAAANLLSAELTLLVELFNNRDPAVRLVRRKQTETFQ
jgi:hypothetical protein